jgi:hypothetical protein
LPRRDSIYEAAIHEAGHALAAFAQGPDYRIKRLELFPHKDDAAHACRGLITRLTRRGTFDPEVEVLIRLSGPAAEAELAAGYWTEAVDIVSARAIIAMHLPQTDFADHWEVARGFVRRERALILHVADALAQPPYRLEEAEIMALLSDPHLIALSSTTLRSAPVSQRA